MERPSAPGSRVLPEALISELEARLGDRFSTAPAVRDHHSRDESYHAPEAPDAVAFPESTDEVRAIVNALRALPRPGDLVRGRARPSRATSWPIAAACAWTRRA